MSANLDDLVRWLSEQLDEDERIARGAADKVAAVIATADRKHDQFLPPYDGAHWTASYDEVLAFDPRPERRRRAEIADCGAGAFMLTPHIARHDPARVLREIDAKRQILRALESAEVSLRNTVPGREPHELMTGSTNSLRAIVRMLATVYADRPGYREEWRP